MTTSEEFKKMFGVEIGIEPKYRSIEEREKEKGREIDPFGVPEEDVCKTSLVEIFAKREEYSIYYKLLQEYRELQHKE